MFRGGEEKLRRVRVNEELRTPAPELTKNQRKAARRKKARGK